MSSRRQSEDFWIKIVEPAVAVPTNYDFLDEVIDFIHANYYPEEIFTEQDLATWASEHGFIKKGD